MTAVDATLPALPQKRHAMLLVLRRLGEARAEDLADALDITVSAARQHLQALVAAGLVGHREERGRPGRPRHVYHVEPAAEAYFPKAYDDLSRELLSLVREEDPVLLARIFDRRRRRRVERARARTDGLTFAERVREVALMLDEEGYLAGVEELGGRQLPADRAQLRGARRGAGAPAHLRVRDRLPARGAAGRERRARQLHARRRARLRVRRPPRVAR